MHEGEDRPAIGTGYGASSPSRFGNSEADLCVTYHVFEATDFRGENGCSEQCEAVVAAAGIVITRAVTEIHNPAAADGPLQVVVERAWSESVLAFGLSRNFLHDGVAMEVVSSNGHEDMEQRGREGHRFFIVIAHHSVSDISDSERVVNVDFLNEADRLAMQPL